MKLFLGHVIILSSCVLGENMGKGINGKELGKGIRQRKDGRYETRIYNQGTGKSVSLYATNLQKLKKHGVHIWKAKVMESQVMISV